MITQGMIIFDVVVGVLGVLLALGFLGVDYNKNKRKKWKCMKGKTTAREVSTETTSELDPNWRKYDTPSQKMDDTRFSSYVFSIDGVEYKGYGNVTPISFSNNIKIRYNPSNPSENCTEHEYIWQTGIGEARFCLISAAVIILGQILLKLIFN